VSQYSITPITRIIKGYKKRSIYRDFGLTQSYKYIRIATTNNNPSNTYNIAPYVDSFFGFLQKLVQAVNNIS